MAGNHCNYYSFGVLLMAVVIDGEEVLYDPTLELSAIESGQTYTTERYY